MCATFQASQMRRLTAIMLVIYCVTTRYKIQEGNGRCAEQQGREWLSQLRRGADGGEIVEHGAALLPAVPVVSSVRERLQSAVSVNRGRSSFGPGHNPASPGRQRVLIGT